MMEGAESTLWAKHVSLKCSLSKGIRDTVKFYMPFCLKLLYTHRQWRTMERKGAK